MAALLSKTTRPEAIGNFERERLFRLLDKGQKRPLSWVSGPAGAGKTTLLSSYIDSRNLRCIWYRLDGGDNDLATFFYYLGIAVQSVTQEDSPLPILTAEYMLGISEFCRDFFEQLAARLHSPTMIVFDDYQEVAEDAPVHKAILDGLTRLSPNIHITIISRWAPPKPFSRHQTYGQIAMVEWDNLQLTREELEKLAHKNESFKCNDKVLDMFHEKTGGWIAGTHLFLELEKSNKIKLKEFLEDNPGELFEYFAAEVFDQLDLKLQQFLVKTCFLSHLTEANAQSITAEDGIEKILSFLNRNNHFTEKRNLSPATYQYHPLFRHFLQSKAPDFLTPEDILAIKRKSAKFMLEKNDTDEAVSLLLDLQDWEELTHVLIAQAPIMLQQGRNLRVNGWLQSVPESYRQAQPWLIYWQAMACIPFDIQKSRQLFEQAFELFKKGNDSAGLFLSWAGVSESIYFSFNNYQDYDKWLKVFAEIEAKSSPYPTHEVEARITASVLNALVFRQPFHKDYEVWFQKAIALLDSNINMATKLQLHHTLCLSQLLARNFNRAKHYIELFRAYVSAESAPPIGVIMQRHTEAFLHWLTAEFDLCHEAINDCLSFGAKRGIHVFDHFLLDYGASAALSEGDVAKADRYFDKLHLVYDSIDDWSKGYYLFLLCWRHVLGGDLVQAKTYQEEGLRYAADTGMPTTYAGHLITEFMLCHLMGLNEKAGELIAECQNFLRKLNIESNDFEFYLFKASVDFYVGRDKEGLQALKKGMEIGSKYNYYNCYLWMASTMSKLCAIALEEDIQTDYVTRLIRKRKLPPPDSHRTFESWPWQLKIYTLGRFELAMDDQPLHYGGKAQQKPLALLKSLLANGGRKVSETTLGDQLWPDADGDMQRKALHTTLHRLRKLLGNKNVLDVTDGKISLNNRYCWVDCWAFEQFLNQAEGAWQMNEDAAAVQQTEKAISLYHAAFLAKEEQQTYLLPLQEKLRSKYLRGVKLLAEYYVDQERFQAAIKHYELGLAIDPLLESFYQQLMICYCHLGQTAEALTQYQRCCNVLKQQLGTSPSKQTQTIYRKLFPAS